MIEFLETKVDKKWIDMALKSAKASEKVVSQDILHEKEEGGVILDLKTNRQLKTFSQLTSLEKKGCRVERILSCPFQSHEVELSAGRVRDPQFGPVITFGLGGIWIEVLQDISYGIAPLSLQKIEEMRSSIRGHSVLEGNEGRRPPIVTL